MSGKYQAYPEYKDTGVEGFGVVPLEWLLSRLKFESHINMGQSPNSDDCNQDGLGLPFLQGNAEFGIRSPSPKQYCEVARKIANKGDLLFSVRAPVGALNLADQDYGIGRGLCAISNNENLTPDFLWWLISVLRTELDSISTGSTFEAVSAEQVENVVIYKPSIYEQQKIANFLDHETAKIDTLIAKQQQLIKLLKEKRQAVISHAVTKGLNPNAPMRDSGVEWLGEVPAHWEVKRLKFAAVNITQKASIDDKKTIALENIESWTGKYIATDSIYSGEDVEFVSGDVLFGKLRPYLAKVYFSEECGIAFGDLLVYRPKETLNGKYCFYQMINEDFIDTVDSSTYGSKMPRASVDFISNMEVVLPPIVEQREIVVHVESAIAQFDEVEAKSTVAIKLMQERRTALISAAVTGKIDVRNWQAPINR